MNHLLGHLVFWDLVECGFMFLGSGPFLFMAENPHCSVLGKNNLEKMNENEVEQLLGWIPRNFHVQNFVALDSRGLLRIFTRKKHETSNSSRRAIHCLQGDLLLIVCQT